MNIIDILPDFRKINKTLRKLDFKIEILKFQVNMQITKLFYSLMYIKVI